MRMLLALLVLAAPVPCQAQDWERIKKEYERFAAETLPRWGIKIEVEHESAGKAGFLPGHLRVTGGYEDADTVQMGLSAGLGSSSGLSVDISGSFDRSADGSTTTGSGSISIPGGSEIRFTYSSDAGFQLGLQAVEGFTLVGVQIGDPKANPFELGIKTGPVTIKVDPVKYLKQFGTFAAKPVEEVANRIGGVQMSFDLGLMAMALTDLPPKDVEKLGDVGVVSLKRLHEGLKAGRAGDFGEVTTVIGLLIDEEAGDILLIGRHEPWAPKIETDYLLALVQSVWRDDLVPTISIEPPAAEPDAKEHFARLAGVSKGLEECSMIHVLFAADYRMKRIDSGADEIRTPGFRPMKRRIEEDLVGQRPFTTTRMWLRPRPPGPGALWGTGDDEGALLMFETGVEVRAASMDPAHAMREGPPHPFSGRFAFEMMRLYDGLEREYPEFKRLRQVFELGQACWILRALPRESRAAELLKALCGHPVARKPHPSRYATHDIDVPELPHLLRGGAEARYEGGDLDDMAVVKEMAPLRRRIRELGWSGWTARAGGAFRAIAREAQLLRAAYLERPLLEDARRESRAGRHREALATIDRGLAADPESGGLLLLRATVLNLMGKHDQALAAADRAIRQRPGDAAGWFERGRARFELKAYREAAADFTKAVELDPRFDYAWHNRAVSKHQLGDFRGAVEDYTEAIRLNPQDPWAFANRALARRELKEHRAAIDDYTLATRLSPRDAEAFLGRGEAHLDLGELKETVADASRAIEIDPRMGRAFLVRGTARAALGNHELAIEDFERILEGEPRHAGALYRRGLSRAELGERRTAVEDFTLALEVNPKFLEALLGRARARVVLEEFREAAEDAGRALEIDPRCIDAWNWRAAARRGLGDLKGAIADFTKAIELDPRNPAFHFNRAVARSEVGDMAGAIADYEKAVELAPSDSHVRRAAEEALRGLKEKP